MLNPQKIAELDQSAKLIGETFPPMLWTFYKGCVQQGFNEIQAMMLTIQILTNITLGQKPEAP